MGGTCLCVGEDRLWLIPNHPSLFLGVQKRKLELDLELELERERERERKKKGKEFVGLEEF